MTPFGPLYNTGSAEFKASGGNPMMLDELMQESAYRQQQQMWMKQQQQMLQLQKQQNKNGGLNSPPNTNSQALPGLAPIRKTRKKRRTYDPTHPVTAPAPKNDEKTDSVKAKAETTPARSSDKSEKD